MPISLSDWIKLLNPLLFTFALLVGCSDDPASNSAKPPKPGDNTTQNSELPPVGTRYVTMSDGVPIAISIHYPEGYDDSQRYPTVFDMSGYDGSEARGRTLIGEAGDAVAEPATGEPFHEPIETGLALASDSRQLTAMFSDAYVVVHASVRGTGCSGGEFDIYSWRSNIDGYELIEWIAKQDFSDGRVAIMGHSYSGMTGFMVAATQPPSLVAVTVSGLIDDVYRGILYPGGVSNYGFPLLWSQGIRPGSEYGGATLPGMLRPANESDDEARAQRCGEHVLARPRDPSKEPALRGSGEFDEPWYRATALVSYLNGDILDQHDPEIAIAAGKTDSSYGITVPIHVTAAYQDEQTGGRGPAHLWELVGHTWSLRDGEPVFSRQPVPKRLLLTNGDHNTQNPYYGGSPIVDDRRAWVDRWMNGSSGGAEVTVLLEKDEEHVGGRIDANNFPLPNSRWTDYYLRSDGQLSPEVPISDEAPDSYLSGSTRQGWFYAGWSGGLDFAPLTTAEGPDELNYRTEPMLTDTTLAGPIIADLWASSNASEGGGFGGTDYFIWLIDEAPDGSLTYLTRGMLRTRHDAIDHDSGRNQAFTDTTGRTETYRFWRYHTEAHLTEPVPGEAYRYLIEVWPVGHVFRAGHRLLIKITRPPVIDAYYAYVPRNQPVTENTIYHDAEHPSRIILPLVPTPPMAAPRPCGGQEGVRCVPGN